jgi:hypothetical protein
MMHALHVPLHNAAVSCCELEGVRLFVHAVMQLRPTLRHPSVLAGLRKRVVLFLLWRAGAQVVVPQGVLVRASAELTVTQALEIADMTLETSCRAIQWAINVPEVLLASAGAHGTITLLSVCMSAQTAAASKAWQGGGARRAAALSVEHGLLAPTVCVCTAGGMLWHGRDLRQYRRLLSPPMELLGTCPGACGWGPAETVKSTSV